MGVDPLAIPVSRAALTAPATGVRVAGARLLYRDTVLLDDLSLAIESGVTTCLLGPSGVGKSSLLRLIAGLIALDRGDVAAEDGSPLARRVAFMDQRYLLLPWLTARENVALGARLRG